MTSNAGGPRYSMIWQEYCFLFVEMTRDYKIHIDRFIGDFEERH